MVLDGQSLTATDVRTHLTKLEGLRERATILSDDDLVGQESELVETFGQAKGQLDSIENDLRKRLASLSPGDPKGMPDLDVIRDRLSRARREELDESGGNENG